MLCQLEQRSSGSRRARRPAYLRLGSLLVVLAATITRRWAKRAARRQLADTTLLGAPSPAAQISCSKSQTEVARLGQPALPHCHALQPLCSVNGSLTTHTPAELRELPTRWNAKTGNLTQRVNWNSPLTRQPFDAQRGPGRCTAIFGTSCMRIHDLLRQSRKRNEQTQG